MIFESQPTPTRLADLPGLNARAVAFLCGPGGGKTRSLRELYETRGVAVLGIDPAGELSRLLEHAPDVDVLEVPRAWQTARVPGTKTALRDWIPGRLRDGAKLCFDVSRVPRREMGACVDAIVGPPWEARVRNVLFLMEECQEYIGQSRGDQSDYCLTVVAIGRNYAWGRILATQRPASVDKEALARCDTWFLGRINHPRDRDAYDEALEMNIESRPERAAILREMMRLKPGHFLLRQPDHPPTVNQ